MVVVHEIGHAIGWIHEQSRPDRDEFVRINFGRIPRPLHAQFDVFPAHLINDHDVAYDYRSVMHYSGNVRQSRRRGEKLDDGDDYDDGDDDGGDDGDESDGDDGDALVTLRYR